MANLLTRKDTLKKVGYSKNHWDRLIADGKAPAPLKPNGPYGRALWIEEEVDEWIRRLIAINLLIFSCFIGHFLPLNDLAIPAPEVL